MKFFTKLIVLILSNALAILIAAKIVRGINIDFTFTSLISAGLLLGFANSIIKPIAKLLSFPFIILTFGLFTVIINIALLLFVSFLLPNFAIESISAALWGTLIISLVNYFISNLIED